MSIEAVVGRGFLKASSMDPSVRDKLAEIIGVGDGDVSTAEALDQDEAEALLGDRSVFAAKFANELGYSFTVAELATVVDAWRRHHAGELSDADLQTALGGEATAPDLAALDKGMNMVYLGIHYHRTMPSPGANMPQVLQFLRKTGEEAALSEELSTILQAGDGDISSFARLDADEAQALLSERGALVAAFAARHGFEFTMADLFAALDAFRRLKNGEMTEGAFDRFIRDVGGADALLPFVEDIAEYTYKGVGYQTAIPSSAQAGAVQVVRFMEKSGDDPELGAQLQMLIGGDGDISAPGKLDVKEAQSLGVRSARVVELGAAHGFHFTVADLNAVVGAFRLVESGDLELESCMRILGMKGAEGVKSSDLVTLTSTAGRIYRGVRY